MKGGTNSLTRGIGNSKKEMKELAKLVASRKFSTVADRIKKFEQTAGKRRRTKSLFKKKRTKRTKRRKKRKTKRTKRRKGKKSRKRRRRR